MKKGKIILEGMRFHCCHGCLESEKTTPNLFVVDFEADADVTAAAAGDSLADTLDYSAVYDIVSSRMGIVSNLLESVCSDIVDALAEAFPALERFSVTVSKHNPPVDGEAEWSRVSIEYSR